MNIGQAAAASGISAKMIRHYEEIGLIPAPHRQASNYRHYGSSDIDRLKFVHRARDLGFPIDRIRDLLNLWGDRNRASADVKAIARTHIAELEVKIEHMREMSRTLRHLAEACEGNERPDCPIIEALEGSRGQQS